MKIKDIMVTDVVSVGPSVSVAQVADIIFSNRFHGLPVVENGEVIGIITEDDFFLKNFDELFLPSYIKFIKENKVVENLPEEIQDKAKRLLDSKASDIMTGNCLTVSPDMGISELMNLIKETKFTTFPVTDSSKKIIGIVTLSDILGTIKRGSRQMKVAFSRNRKANELDKIAEELSSVWNDNLVIMSKKKVRTWKGVAFVSLAAILGIILLIAINANNKNICGLVDKQSYPLECQKFNYTSWSPCQEGISTRQVIQKLPQNCEGGAVPELVKPCQ